MGFQGFVNPISSLCNMKALLAAMSKKCRKIFLDFSGSQQSSVNHVLEGVYDFTVIHWYVQWEVQ